MNTKQMMMRAVTIAAAGAIAFVGVAPVIAAPVLSSTATVKMAVPDMLDQVRVRRGRRGAIGAGIALGVIGAVAGAPAASRSYDYGPGYYGAGHGFFYYIYSAYRKDQASDGWEKVWAFLEKNLS